MADTPISNAPVMGNKVEPTLDKDGFVVPPSTLANQAAEDDKGRNPDYFESMGGDMQEQNEVGKGANPSADVTTKNDTTIDPIRREPSPTADDRVVPRTVPASLPEDAPISAPDGTVHTPGEATTVTPALVTDTKADKEVKVKPAPAKK